MFRGQVDKAGRDCGQVIGIKIVVAKSRAFQLSAGLAGEMINLIVQQASNLYLESIHAASDKAQLVIAG